MASRSTASDSSCRMAVQSSVTSRTSASTSRTPATSLSATSSAATPSGGYTTNVIQDSATVVPLPSGTSSPPALRVTGS